MESHFEFCSTLPVSIEEAFAYHARFGALSRLLPPWQSLTIERNDHSLAPGSEVHLKVGLAGLRFRMIARHQKCEAPRLFSDELVRGPFASWVHEHRFVALGDSATELCDSIRYRLPFGALGHRLGNTAITRELEAMFACRHRVTREDLVLGQKLAAIEPKRPTRGSIAVSGSHGLIGESVVSLLSVLGYRVIRLERPGRSAKGGGSSSPSPRPQREKPVIVASATEKTDVSGAPASSWWDPDQGLLHPEELNGAEAVIHLAGQSIAEGRWTPTRKAMLWKSRVDATHRLADQLARLPLPPRAFVTASGIGLYGETGEVEVDEQQPADSSFLGRLASAWEEASHSLLAAGVRVVHGRLSTVLTPRGGALASMLPIFRGGLGGKMGDGRQYWSWISHEDAVAAFVWLALNPHCEGPFNLVAGSLPNEQFTRVLGDVLRRPTILKVPRTALRWMLGEMADALLLTSTRAGRAKLTASGYPFRLPDLKTALEIMLGKHSSTVTASSKGH